MDRLSSHVQVIKLRNNLRNDYDKIRKKIKKRLSFMINFNSVSYNKKI